MTYRFYYILHPAWGIGGASGYGPNPQPYTKIESAYYNARRYGGRVVTLEAKPVAVSPVQSKEATNTKLGIEQELKALFPEAFQ